MIGHALKALSQYVRAPAAWSAEKFGDDIEEEIRFHISERARELTDAGMPEEDAKRAALQRFGDTSRIAAECHAGAVGGLAMWHRLHLAMTVALAVAVGALWLSTSSPTESPLALASQLPAAIASMIDNDWTGDVRGRILDDGGRPIENAHVLVVVKTWPDESYFQRAYAAVTDADGRFLIDDVHPVDERYEVQIAAVADRRVLQSSYHSRPRGTLNPVVFRLPPSSGFALRVEASRGESLADIEVLPHGRVDAGGTEHLVYFDSAQTLVRRTDGKGRVELPYFQPGDTATVMLRAPHGEWESRDVVVPANGGMATIRTSLDQPNERDQTLQRKDS